MSWQQISENVSVCFMNEQPLKVSIICEEHESIREYQEEAIEYLYDLGFEFSATHGVWEQGESENENVWYLPIPR